MNQSFSLSLNGSCMNDVPASKPDIKDGMIPVVISSNGITSTVSEDDASWYNYNNKEWANMVLVNDSSRSTYQNTSGVVVSEEDILAYYVWIPRYKYRIPEVKCSTLTNPTYEENPECYVYVLSDSDKTLLINWWYSYVQDAINQGFVSGPYTLEEATTDVNNALQKGIFSNASLGIEMSTSQLIDIYVLSDSDKTLLINWVHAYAQSAGFTSYTLEEATTDVNNALQTGTFSNASLGIEVTTSQLIDMYNQNNSDNQITYTMEISSSYNYTGPREIDIIYEDKSTTKTLGDAVNTYYTHPAFTFGNTEVNGIWVGKFETGGTATAPLIMPNISSLRNQTVSAEFTTAQRFGTSTYGMTSNVDAHMMKNSEWGAVAYLSHSRYGANREIYINNSSGYYTGRSGGNVGGSTAINTVYTSQTSTSQYNTYYGFYTWDGYLLEYNTNTKSSTHDISKVSSTTGNITGVYDMSGGAWEYVMGYYSPAGSTWGATSLSNYAGFSSQPNSKYYDDYTATNSLTACNDGICYGHGLSEVSDWYDDSASFVYAGNPWFLRGGGYNTDSSAGTFSFDIYNGSANINSAARSVLVVGRLQ
ncbi:unknown [Clostridium sp. CAG:914]|nr:unknown [Clostridium sp. CAG:914]